MLTLSTGQQQALDMIGVFLKDADQRIAIMTGYAGTGKSTLIKVIATTYGTPEVLTPTGKAALRVHEVTGLPAGTIHRAFYKAEVDPRTGAPIFILKDVWELSFLQDRLVLIDESSMVSKDVWIDLNAMSKTLGFKILLVGDRFQLPPVTKSKEDEGFNSLNTPTPYSINLTEVHRQALDSPIIRASMLLRSNKPEFEAMGLLDAIGESQLTESLLDFSANGAVVCHTNARRHDLNNKVRTAKKYEHGTLQSGEPLLVLQNNYSLDCYNGEVLDFHGWDTPPELLQTVTDRYTTSSIQMKFGVGHVDGSFGGNSLVMLSPDEICGRTIGSNVGLWAFRRAAKKAFERIARYGDDEAPPYVHANYGYALTVHKSQGSEFEKVLVVIEDSLSSMKGIERKRFLYTAVTRARTACSYIYLQEPVVSLRK